MKLIRGIDARQQEPQRCPDSQSTGADAWHSQRRQNWLLSQRCCSNSCQSASDDGKGGRGHAIAQVDNEFCMTIRKKVVRNTGLRMIHGNLMDEGHHSVNFSTARLMFIIQSETVKEDSGETWHAWQPAISGRSESGTLDVGWTFYRWTSSVPDHLICQSNVHQSILAMTGEQNLIIRQNNPKYPVTASSVLVFSLSQCQWHWWWHFEWFHRKQTRSLVVGFLILHNIKDSAHKKIAFNVSGHSLVHLDGCRSLVVNWPAIASIACVTTYNRFLHLIGANDQGHIWWVQG